MDRRGLREIRLEFFMPTGSGAGILSGNQIKLGVERHVLNPQLRKAKTEAFLQKEGIPFLPSLPCVESDASTYLRSVEEVGIRIACLFCIIGCAFESDVRVYEKYLREHNLWDHLTPIEVSFLSNAARNPQTTIDLTWRCEALFLLMWAVHLFDTLPMPCDQTNNSEIISRFPGVDTSPWPFIHDLQLRPKAELLDASDLIYRLHWATRNAQLQGESPPAELVLGVIQEWHHAINWITRYSDQEWDSVTTDT